MNYNNTLRQLIKENGMTIKQVAERANIPATTLYSLADRPIGSLKLEILERVAVVTGIGINNLIQASYGWEENIGAKNALILTNDDFTDDELDEIRKFAEFIKTKRKTGE